ncbi:MAG: hypothetical protein HQK59_06695 [Deltaproteobacteria bacterium]|nr:hypothetical protein [Deltaproteobacteria bacterium]
MTQLFDAGRSRDVSELTRQSNYLSGQLAELSAELDSAKEALTAKTAYLQSLSREYALTTNKIKESSAEIYRFKKKRTDIDEGAFLLLQEFERSRSELIQLKERKQDLDRKIAQAGQDQLQSVTDLAALDQSRQEVLPRMKDLESESAQLTSAISSNLADASSKVEKTEHTLDQMLGKLLGYIGERDSIKDMINEQEAAVFHLKDEIDHLSRRIQDLKETKLLLQKRTIATDELDELNRDVGSVEVELKARRKELATKRQQLEALTRQNDERSATIDSLGKEVGPYLAARTALEAVKERDAALAASIKDGLTKFVDLFQENVRLGQDIHKTADKSAALISFSKAFS